MYIIPAIDLIEGKCVRLTQGDFSQKKIYNEDPLEVALQFEAHGIERLHLVDLDGAQAGRVINHAVLERLANKTGLWIDFGGGLQSDQDVRIAFESGASQITGGTIAVKNEALFLSWVERYGAESIILGADVREGKITVNGWKEQSEMELMPFLSYFHEKGLQYAISTDVSKDGLLQGSALELYRNIREEIPGLALIASGGVSALDELDQLNDIGCFGVIIGKALYEGIIRLTDLEPYL